MIGSKTLFCRFINMVEEISGTAADTKPQSAADESDIHSKATSDLGLLPRLIDGKSLKHMRTFFFHSRTRTSSRILSSAALILFRMSVCLSAFPPFRLSTFPPFCLPAYLSICLSFCSYLTLSHSFYRQRELGKCASSTTSMSMF